MCYASYRCTHTHAICACICGSLRQLLFSFLACRCAFSFRLIKALVTLHEGSIKALV